MARLAVGVVFGFVVGVLAGAAAGLHAQSEPTDDTVAAAAEANLDPMLVQGAVNSQPGIDARTYLVGIGLLTTALQGGSPSAAVGSGSGSPPLTGRLACIARAESRNDPNATNPRSGAAGLFQFLYGTWMSTPQGQAGLSRYDPAAATAAAEWMVAQGRIREWVPVQQGVC